MSKNNNTFKVPTILSISMGLRIDYSLDIIPEFLIVFWWLLSFLVVSGEKRGVVNPKRNKVR